MPRFEQDFLISYGQDELVAELKRIARVLNKQRLSRADIDKHGRVNSGTVIKKFGSLRKALQAAGLRPVRFMKASDAELLEMLIDLWTKTLEKKGRRPFRSDLKLFGFPVHADTYVRRYGSWKAALSRANDSVPIGEGAANGIRDREKPTNSPGPNGEIISRRGISVHKRFLVFKRDRYRCRICKASGVEIEVDHIVPRAKGGSDALDNLQTLCRNCNRGKRDSFE